MNSSQVLTVVAVFVIAFAAFNLIITMDKVGKLTGYANFGTANLTIESSIILNFTVDMVNWSSGSINTSAGYSSGSLDTQGNRINVSGFQAVTTPLKLESLSSVNISVNLSSSVNGTGFMTPDSAATFEWRVTNDEAGSCTQGLPSGYTLVSLPGTTAGTTVCQKLQLYPNRNSLNVDLRVNFTTAANPGTKGAVITATGWCGPPANCAA